MNKTGRISSGFTLIELILVIGVFSLIFSSATVVFGNMIGRNSLKYHGYQVVQNLREARTNSVIQKNDSAWGLHFDDLSSPQRYTFFKGDNYLDRDSAYDLDFELPEVIYISQFNLGGSKEIVFSKSDGDPSAFGSLALSTDTQSYLVFINSFGLIDYHF